MTIDRRDFMKISLKAAVAALLPMVCSKGLEEKSAVDRRRQAHNR
jgi:hypothetical protein